MTVNVARLDRLATMLENYQTGEIKFDLENWGSTQIKRQGFLWFKKVECGFAACAIGLACLSREFRDEGLGYAKDTHDEIFPTFRAKTNWAAVEAFFGLSYDQALNLFQDTRYKCSKGSEGAYAVAARIRKLIQRSNAGRRSRVQRRTTAAVEQIKAYALESV